MALKDLIATSGARNFETMRKGWLPTPEEQSSRRLKDLQVQAAEQKVSYEPERQNYLRQKQKAELKKQEQTTALFDKEMTKYKTDEEIIKKERSEAY